MISEANARELRRLIRYWAETVHTQGQLYNADAPGSRHYSDDACAIFHNDERLELDQFIDAMTDPA